MKISYNWLCQFLPKVYHDSPENLSELLTDIGLEVEGLERQESIKGGLKNICIGEVQDLWQHPNADRLQMAKVNVGAENTLQIVCGAKNIAKSQKVVVALVGSVLHFSNGDVLEIKKSKLRGEVSEGMICAEDEIGVGTGHEGIMVLPNDVAAGTAAAEYFKVDVDDVFEIGLTPNRADAISHFGVARDVVAAKNVRLNLSERIVWSKTISHNSEGASPIKIDLRAKERCTRYAGVFVENIAVEESPAWLKNALLSIGITPKNNLVDLTNYVCHAIGQPLHAFDAEKIKGQTVVVKDGLSQSFTTLDGLERTLNPEDLMICNMQDPMCIAGVFGGLNSGVQASTKSIFLESAYFNPISIRKSAKRHGLNTDASYRFERGVDPDLCVKALEYAIGLLKTLCPTAKIYDIVEATEPMEKYFQVDFSPKKANALIGLNLNENDIEQVLHALDIQVEKKESLWQLKVPAYRVDVQRQADIAEEILRLKGFNSVDIPQKISLSVAPQEHKSKESLVQAISTALVSMGFNEAINNSLSSEKHELNFGYNPELGVKMLNPLSQDLDIMRQSLIGPLVKNVLHNVYRQRKNVRFFEFGRNYLKTQSFIENEQLCLILSGKTNDRHWAEAERNLNFFDLKNYVDRLLALLIPHAPIKQKESDINLYDYALECSVQKKSLVTVGQLNRKTLKKLGLEQDVFAANFNLDVWLEAYKKPLPKISELPKYPEVRRDLSFLVPSGVKYQQVEDVVKKSESKLLKSVGLFDLYEGNKLPDGKKSYAIYMIFRDEDKTLEDVQIEKSMARIMQNLSKQLDIEIRQ